MDTLLLIAVLAVVLPVVTYFVAKFAIYGFLRGIELYDNEHERRRFFDRNEE